ncbi:MAG: hypothetical protein RBT80_23120 [Candidatus Vecturithrix sp.]|jgi:hypothetical protein|nr:hypothetical protein [Candidatus Vecturithrix sp.]
MKTAYTDLRTKRKGYLGQTNKPGVLLVVIIGAGLLVRLAFSMILPDPNFLPRVQHETDVVEYFAIAQNLLAGQGFSLDGEIPTAFRPPVYPLLIALCHVNPYGVVFLHLVGFVFSSWLLWRIAVRVLHNKYRAIVVVGCYAIYVEFVAYDMLFITENVFMMGFLGSIEGLFILRKTPYKVFLMITTAGCAALTALTRPIGLYLFPLLFVLLGFSRIEGFHWQRLAFMLFIFFLVLSPWFLRNYYHFQQVVFVTNGGSNLYFGNLRDGTKGWPSQSDDFRPAGNEVQKDRIYIAEAIHLIKNTWKTVPLLWFRKLLRLWFNLGYGHDYRWSYQGMFVTLSRFLLFSFFSATIFWWKSLDPLFLVLLLFLMIFFTGLHVVIYASPRFFIPVLPFMIIAILSGGIPSRFRVSQHYA